MNRVKIFGVAATLGLALPYWAVPAHAGVVPPGALSDLAITLTATPNPVRAGSQLTYTAVLTNLGPDPAAEVYIAMPLPAGTTLVSAAIDTPSSPGAACSLVGGVVRCFSFFGVGATTSATPRTATIVVSVSDVTARSITASASAELGILFIPPIPRPDPDFSNNTASITTTVGIIANVPSLDRSGLVLIALLFGLIGVAGLRRPGWLRRRIAGR